LKPDEQSWIKTKLELAGIDPEQDSIGGYGDRVIRQVLADNRFLSDLRKMTRQRSWRRDFSSFLDELIWMVAAANRIVT
jgi:hypothetical protein